MDTLEIAVDALDELDLLAREQLHEKDRLLAAQIRQQVRALMRSLQKVGLRDEQRQFHDRKRALGSVVRRYISQPAGRTFLLLNNGLALWRSQPIGDYQELGKMTHEEVKEFLAQQPGTFVLINERRRA